MKAAPGAKELEMALLQLLRKNDYTGPEHVSVLLLIDLARVAGFCFSQ